MKQKLSLSKCHITYTYAFLNMKKLPNPPLYDYIVYSTVGGSDFYFFDRTEDGT